MSMADKSAAEQLKAIKFAPVIYPHLQVPNGFLSPERASHALWYYYLCARQTYETHVKDIIVLEGDADPSANFRRLIEMIAKAYGVEVGNMVQAWPEIDMQCTALNLPQLPDEEQYRFNRPGRIQ
jgi:hypothetical protein